MHIATGSQSGKPAFRAATPKTQATMKLAATTGAESSMAPVRSNVRLGSPVVIGRDRK